MNSNPLDQLRETLHREAQHIQPVGLGVETVERRGRRRRNRGRAAVAVTAAICVGFLGVALVERGSSTPDRVAVAADASPSTPALDFRTVDGTVSEVMSHFTTAGGVTYALSTAPGVSPSGSSGGQAIYATSDGEHWTSANQGTPWISDLTGNNGVLYAVGTAPGSGASDVTYRLGTSSDGGNTWSDADLPFDLSTPSATVPISRSSFVQLASGPTATVAVLSEAFSPDLTALIAQRVPNNSHVIARMTTDGYDLVDMSSCVAAKPAAAAAGLTPGDAAVLAQKERVVGDCENGPVLSKISWSDLGLTGAGDLSHEEMLVSTDGTHWDSVAAPTSWTVSNLVATSDGFLMLAQNDNPNVGTVPPSNATTLLQSTDGRNWSTVATPAGLNVQAIAGDRIEALDAAGNLETSSDGGQTWNTTVVSSLLPAGAPAEIVSDTDAGPLGFAVVVAPTGVTSGHDYLLFSVDGIDWTTTDLSTVGQPAGDYPMQVTVGADHVSVDYGGAATAAGAPMKITTLLGTPQR